MAYSPGKEEEYVRCILYEAHVQATKNTRGKDKDIVRRATEALVQLQRQCPGGVPGDQILLQTGFTAYKNPNSHGLWPWLRKYGGIEVVVKKGGSKYIIVDKFYPALTKCARVRNVPRGV
jgi:hypothetical protein